MAPQPPAPEPSDSIEFGNFSGIKNTVDPTHLTDKELERAINVDLNDVGGPARRRGRTLVSSGAFHSLFQSNAGKVFGVKNQTLGVINPDYSFTPIRSGVGAQPPVAQLAYVQVGDQIFFSSPNECGIILERLNTVSSWGPAADIWLSPVINPTAGLPAIAGRLLGPPPLASYLAYWSGRIYLAQDALLWATELYLYSMVDKTKNFFQFEAPITMVAAVGDGVYVGTQEGCWFLSGATLKELKRTRVLDSPVIPGSMVYMPAELANPPQIDLGQDTPVSLAVLFMTANGYCAGQNGGQCFNLTESKVTFPEAVSASAFYRKQDGINQYIAVLNSEGTPTSSACIGDYVDAELIRASDA